MTAQQKKNVETYRTYGISYNEIARKTGISVETIKSHCKRHGIKNSTQSRVKSMHSANNAMHQWFYPKVIRYSVLPIVESNGGTKIKIKHPPLQTISLFVSIVAGHSISLKSLHKNTVRINANRVGGNPLVE